MAATSRYFPRLSLGLSGTGSGGDEDKPPRYQPMRVKSAHELDDARFIDPLQKCFECAICGSTFRTPKSCRRHMVRSHRGGLAPGAPVPVAPVVLRHACQRCGKRFLTWRALAGHRSNHNGKLGQAAVAAIAAATAAAAAAAAAPPPPPVVIARDFDLNELPPEAEEEEQQQVEKEKEKEKDPAAN
ncbi:hypothetical protein BRADI_1g29823v3 [Brachypodium distachyon]|uniref:C2H2-type domain-containing protein n=1 Tax=Brachypodium distachyon TaxID=15368 RepID=A0A0Q3NGZ5_BRADI|nr:hypothetical protein BRADI_1g29823v3 [Brachypodium distachyon]